MDEAHTIEPDLEFSRSIIDSGAETLYNCDKEAEKGEWKHD